MACLAGVVTLYARGIGHSPIPEQASPVAPKQEPAVQQAPASPVVLPAPPPAPAVSAPSNPAPPAEGDKAAVKQRMEAIAAAFNAKDLDKVFANFSDDFVNELNESKAVTRKEWEGEDAVNKFQFDASEITVQINEQHNARADVRVKMRTGSDSSIHGFLLKNVNGNWLVYALLEEESDELPDVTDTLTDEDNPNPEPQY